MIPCDSIRETIQESLDGRLDAERREALEAHMAGCAGCRAYRIDLGRLDGALGAQEAAPAALLDRLGLADAPAPPRRSRWALGAAAGFAVALGLGLAALGPSPAPTIVATAPATAEGGESVLSWLEPEAPAEVVLPSDALFAEGP